jgi:hypothetical protein
MLIDLGIRIFRVVLFEFFVANFVLKIDTFIKFCFPFRRTVGLFAFYYHLVPGFWIRLRIG